MLWELRDGPIGARALQQRCDGMSSSVLYERLGELADAGLIRQNGEREYELTAIGADLRDAIGPLDAWARRWARPVSRG